MPPTDETTTNRGYQKPFITNKLNYDVGRLRTALDSIDNEIVVSDPAGITGADQVRNIVSLTQAEYDAIGSPDAATLYCITD